MELTTLRNIDIKHLENIQSILDKRLSAVDGVIHLGLSRSQVHRLLKRYKSGGAAAIRHKARGRPSNHKTSLMVKDFAMSQVKEKQRRFWANTRRREAGGASRVEGVA